MLSEVYKICYLYLLRSIYIYLNYNVQRRVVLFYAFSVNFYFSKKTLLDSKILKLVCISVLLIGQRSDFRSTFYKHNYAVKKV